MSLGNKSPDESGWGGPWTEKKLDAFIKYVTAYLTIMNKHPRYRTIYFDGLAGSGERKSQKELDALRLIDIREEEMEVYRGAAERVIRLNAPFVFDFYYFIDQNESSLESLKSKINSLHNAVGRRLEFRPGDCNVLIEKLASALKDNTLAALIFLDPFGMQIQWDSISKLRGTHSDLWILLPTGVIVNRLLDRKGELKSIKKLESFFGLSEEEIRQLFYVKTKQGSLFSEYPEHIAKVTNPISRIADIYAKQLGTIWEFVTPNPLILKNNSGVPIFHFVFASNNTAAVKIAKEIIEKK